MIIFNLRGLKLNYKLLVIYYSYLSYHIFRQKYTKTDACV